MPWQNALPGKAKVKKKKVSAKELQENIRKIQDALTKATPGSDVYEKLSKELEHEYVILRKYKDAKFYVEPKQWMSLLVGGAVVVFFVCLEREVPSVTKFCNLLFKIMPFRG